MRKEAMNWRYEAATYTGENGQESMDKQFGL